MAPGKDWHLKREGIIRDRKAGTKIKANHTILYHKFLRDTLKREWLFDDTQQQCHILPGQ